MAITRWKVLERSTYQHTRWRRLEDVTFELPSGEVRQFSLKKEGSGIAILALTPNADVILTRQYRPGPDRVLDELPGGGIEAGETPAEAARRELLEETGFVPGELRYLGRPLECAYSTIERHAFLALDCVRAGPQRLDASEFIEVVEKSVHDFLQQLRAGDCTDPEVGWMGLFELGCLEFKPAGR